MDGLGCTLQAGQEACPRSRLGTTRGATKRHCQGRCDETPSRTTQGTHVAVVDAATGDGDGRGSSHGPHNGISPHPLSAPCGANIQKFLKLIFFLSVPPSVDGLMSLEHAAAQAKTHTHTQAFFLVFFVWAIWGRFRSLLGGAGMLGKHVDVRRRTSTYGEIRRETTTMWGDVGAIWLAFGGRRGALEAPLGAYGALLWYFWVAHGHQNPKPPSPIDS